MSRGLNPLLSLLMSSGLIPKKIKCLNETSEQYIFKLKYVSTITEFLPKLLGFQTVVEGWRHVVMNVGHFDSQNQVYEILVIHVCSLILTFTSKKIFSLLTKRFLHWNCENQMLLIRKLYNRFYSLQPITLPVT